MNIRGFFLIYVFAVTLVLSTPNHVQASPSETVTATVEFRVFTDNMKDVPNAQVIIIGNDGNILTSGRSDSTGTVRIPITTQKDPRFPSFTPSIGTVTAITVANGYNEYIIFDVPVSDGSVQPIALSKFTNDLFKRNEPSYTLGMSKFPAFSMLDTYAKKAGLQRQPTFPNDEYSPWGTK